MLMKSPEKLGLSFSLTSPNTNPMRRRIPHKPVGLVWSRKLGYTTTSIVKKDFFIISEDLFMEKVAHSYLDNIQTMRQEISDFIQIPTSLVPDTQIIEVYRNIRSFTRDEILQILRL